MDESDRSSSRSDEDNVYGVNNLDYLRDQIKGYNSDAKHEQHHPSADHRSKEFYMTADDGSDNVSIKLSPNGTGTIEFVSIPYNNQSTAIEYESSGDGASDDEYDTNETNAENKFGVGMIPNNYDSSSVISAQLQRLSQLVQSAENEKKQTFHLKPEQLTQFLVGHNLQFENVDRYTANKYSEPIPEHGMIDSNHLDQIIDLQNKLNKLVATKNELSTPSPPYAFDVSGNGVYPSDATTVHIKATNSLKNPDSAESPFSSSQIVVNRPAGTVVFRLPATNPDQVDHKNDQGHISEETLKRLLELSQKMSNQAPNTPNFVHDVPHSGYYPIVQPILFNNNFPWNELKTLIGALKQKKEETQAKEPEPQPQTQPLTRVSSVNGVVSSDNPMAASSPEDTGPTTIVHTHIPITIAHPPTSNSLVNRIQHEAITTARPQITNRFDSYGNNIAADELRPYESYPPLNTGTAYHGANQYTPSLGLQVYQPHQDAGDFTRNVEQPQYIQIAQSRPDPYMPQPSLNGNAIMSQFSRPITTFASINGGHTQRIDSQSAQPSQAINPNLKHFGQSEPSYQSSNYVPIYSSASNPKPSYAPPSTIFSQNTQKLSVVSDKMEQYIEPSVSNDEENYANKSDESDDYVPEIEDQSNENNANENDEDDVEDDDGADEEDDGNVMSLLANYHAQPKQEVMNTIVNTVDLRPPPPSRPPRNPNTNKNYKSYVIFHGNIIDQETFEESIGPYLQGAAQAQVEYLTCATGVRQANSTDCTKYFVCDSRTGKILSYTCPPFTAFNADTKICNAETYSKCFPISVKPNKGVGNRLMEQQTLIEANRVRTEALQAQQLAQLVQLETKKLLAAQQANLNRVPNMGKATKMPAAPTKPAKRKRPAQKVKHKKPSKSTTNTKNQTQAPSKLMGKRKIPCRSEGKLADRLSRSHYFMCYKDGSGTMRARRLQCPAKLTFCEGSHVCTQSGRCTEKRFH